MLHAHLRSHLLPIILLAGVYFVTAKLGLKLAVVGNNVTLIWPPTGIALAALLLYGNRLWPGIAIGAFVVNFTTGLPFLAAVGIAAGNTLEAVAGLYLLRLSGFDVALKRVPDVLALLVLAGTLSTTVAATVGAATLGLAGVIPWSEFGWTWLTWWMGDAMGDVVFAPLILIWAQWRKPEWSGLRWAELAALFLSALVISEIVFGGWFAEIFGKHPLAFLTFPFVIWAAMRFGRIGATTVALFLTFVALSNMVQENGTFGFRSLLERHTMLWFYSTLLAATGLLLAVAVGERRRMEVLAKHQAQHDDLTGLPNRKLLQDRIQQALNHAVRHQRRVGLLFIDLDRFKVVNDTLGHDVGDGLLQMVGDRLRQCVREEDTVARQGGDEFVVVLGDISQAQEAGLIAQKIIDSISGAYPLRGYELYVAPSIGISLYPEDGTDAHSLMKNADTAMYSAKKTGATYRFYAAEMNASAFQRMAVEGNLRHAVTRNELSLYYQPQIDIPSGRIIGVEALIRWPHPELGMMLPDAFIPIAEESGLIIPLGEWVLAEACRQLCIWRKAGHSDLRIAVNISSRQLWQLNFVETVFRILDESGADSAGLELELTESMLMRHTEETVVMLEQLRARGIRLSVDDFGTGYSSLAYLKRFPIDTLKIDQSFVRDVIDDPNDAAIVGAIIAIACRLDLNVIAEGVETQEQLEFIQKQGCDQAQGYYFSKPLPADQCSLFLKESVQYPQFG